MRFQSLSRTSASCALALALILGLTLSLLGCGSDSSPVAPTSGWESDSGTLALGIRVAADDVAKSEGSPPVPEGVAELYLTFETITAFRAPAEQDSSCDSTGHGSSSAGSHGDGEGEAVPVEILTDPVTLEILALGETLTALIAEADLPDGRYMKIELGLVEAWAVTDSGVVVPVGLPPAGDSLLKVVSPFVVVNGEATALVFEIDLGRSLRESPPGSGELVLRPVIRARIVPHGESCEWARHNGDEYGQGEGENCQGSDDEHGQGSDDEHGNRGMGEGGATDASWGGSTGQGGSENGSGGSASARSGGTSGGASSGH